MWEQIIEWLEDRFDLCCSNVDVVGKDIISLEIFHVKFKLITIILRNITIIMKNIKYQDESFQESIDNFDDISQTETKGPSRMKIL